MYKKHAFQTKMSPEAASTDFLVHLLEIPSPTNTSYLFISEATTASILLYFFINVFTSFLNSLSPVFHSLLPGTMLLSSTVCEFHNYKCTSSFKILAHSVL